MPFLIRGHSHITYLIASEGGGVTEISYFIMRERGVSNQKLHNKRLLKNDRKGGGHQKIT